MARRRQANAEWSAENREGAVNNMFAAMRDTAQAELGANVSIGSDGEAGIVGLPLPALALKYLFQSTVLPLSRIVQITGEEGSAKSALLYEIMRWHMVYGGGAALMENENKDSPELRKSIFRWDPNFLSRCIATPTYTLEEWQAALTQLMATSRAWQDAPTGPGRTIPTCFGVDSIMATATKDEVAGVEKDGYASRGFAIAANLIARYMRTMPKQIQNYPFTIVGTNHLKPSTTAQGLPTASVPGGKAVKFMETYEIEMKRAPGKHDIDLLEYGGLRLRLTARKNSLGPSRKSITAELLWWYSDDGTGALRQQTAWDWNTATIEMILAFETLSGKKTIYNRLKEITGIRATSRSRKEACSSVLGVPSTAPVPYRVLGGMLEERLDLMPDIYHALGIAERAAFQPGVDYLLAQENARAAGAADAVENLYNDIEELPVGGVGDGTDDVIVEEPPQPGDDDYE